MDTQTFLNNISELCSATLKSNTWYTLEDLEVSIYLRTTRRYLHSKKGFYLSIEVSSISVAERSRGKGHLKKLLTEIKEIARHSGRIVLVESVLEERLQGYLERVGFLRDSDFECPNYFWIPVALEFYSTEEGGIAV